MSNVFAQGLTLSVLGMGLTFLSLGLLILAIIVLERLFRPKKAVAEPAPPSEKPASGSLERATDEEEVVAAIAAALAYLRSIDICESGLGSTLETGPSRWWYAGRAQQAPANMLKITRWRN